MRTIKADTSMLNEPMYWNVYSQFYCASHTPIDGTKTSDGYAHKNCYASTAKYRFTRPSYNSFYMKVLRQLIELGSANAYQLGCKAKMAGVLVRHNTDTLTAMHNAGMISYDRKADAWSVTEAGKKYYKAAIEALRK